MPIDRIRRLPFEKILSSRSMKSKNDKGNDSNNINYQDESDVSIDSDLALLPPPRRSALSRLSPRRMSRCRSLILKWMLCLSAIFLFLLFLPRQPLRKKVKPTFEMAILLWNDKLPNGRHHLHQCDCVVTSDRNYINAEIDAIIFNADRPYSIEGLEKIDRKSNFFSVFAAKNPLRLAKNPLSVHGESIFNFTMTYRLDSDIIWSDYYFSTVGKAAQRAQIFEEPQEKFGVQKLSVTNSHLRYNLNLKQQLAVYLTYDVDNSTYYQSIYLQELRKHMHLNVIQTCHETIECIPYKFMLIFEASGCPDYVHPQMYMAYANYVVPVLIGGGNLSGLVPPNSFISAEHYASPQYLAEHLKWLSVRPEIYEQYFCWHSKYKIHRMNQPFCALCLQLSQARTCRSNDYFLHWWTQYTCPEPSNYDFKNAT